MTINQIIRITTKNGTEDVDADRVQVEGEEYVLLLGEVEVRRVPISDVVTEIDPETGEGLGGIQTAYSRS